jgi:hypothetical protein
MQYYTPAELTYLYKPLEYITILLCLKSILFISDILIRHCRKFNNALHASLSPETDS